ncbi:MAG: glycosyltransferase [Oscillospiraceae bacterium]|nr:glycosyltransferase [Oscillospiraceae bacterium]
MKECLIHENEKISVIMGIYNCAATLPEAIDSILNQTYKNWELILCDDGSVDDTYQVAKRYADDYPDKIILIRNETNRKLAYSLNRCLEYATGDFIARMDGDDISLPVRFEKQLFFLKEHPEYDLVGCAMQRFDAEGFSDIIYAEAEPDYYALRNNNPFFHPTILARKVVFDGLGGYTVVDRTARSEDYDLWFRFYHAGFQGCNLQEALYLIREDMAAIRRRTFKTRWGAFKTTLFGFKLLGYPRWWIIKPAVVTAFKSIVPYKAIELYRKWQKRSARQK